MLETVIESDSCDIVIMAAKFGSALCEEHMFGSAIDQSDWKKNRNILKSVIPFQIYSEKNVYAWVQTFDTDCTIRAISALFHYILLSADMWDGNLFYIVLEIFFYLFQANPLFSIVYVWEHTDRNVIKFSK